MIYERYVFFARNQQISEPIDHYVTELKKLAQSCEFETLTNGLIRDRIVCGLQDNGLRKRLLRTGELTLGKTVSRCRATETTKNQIKTLTRAANVGDYTVHGVHTSGQSQYKPGKPKKKYNNTDLSLSLTMTQGQGSFHF